MPARIDIPTAATAVELVESGVSFRDAGRRLGIAADTVANILNGDHGWSEVTDRPIFRQYRVKQNQALEQAARTLAAKAFTHAEATLDKASFYQAVVGGSILIDKARLLAGEATQNIEVHTKHDVSGLDKLASALGQALIPVGLQPTNQAQVGASGSQVPDIITPVIDSVSTPIRKRAKRKVKR
jgi:hypothetical protein